MTFASVVRVATSLISKLIVVSGVADQPKKIAQLKNMVPNALEGQFTLHRSAMTPNPGVIIIRKIETEIIMKLRGHTSMSDVGNEKMTILK